MTLWFGSHTDNARLTELLYVVADVWSEESAAKISEWSWFWSNIVAA